MVNEYVICYVLVRPSCPRPTNASIENALCIPLMPLTIRSDAM